MPVNWNILNWVLTIKTKIVTSALYFKQDNSTQFSFQINLSRHCDNGQDDQLRRLF